MRFLSLANRNLKEIYRDPVTTLLGLAMPVSLLILFSSISKKTPIEIFSPQSITPGIIIFSYAFLMMFIAVLLAKDKQYAFLTRLFTAPLKSSDFILAYLIPLIPLALLQTAICFIIGLILGASFSNIILSLIILFIMAINCINIGIVLGALFTVNQVSGIGSILITAIGLFSGAWLDLNMVGGVFNSIGYALPFAHAVDASKALLSGGNFNHISTHFFVVLGYSIVFFFLAVLSFKRTMKKV